MYRRGGGGGGGGGGRARGQGRPLDWGNSNATNVAGRQIFVGNLPHQTKMDDILNFFGPSDIIERVRLHPGYAIVQFKRSKDHTRAIIDKHGRKFLNRQIKVEEYNPEKPRADRRSRGSSPPSRALERYSPNASNYGQISGSPLRDRTPYISRDTVRSRSRSLSEERAPMSLFQDSSSSSARMSDDRIHREMIKQDMQSAISSYNQEKPTFSGQMQAQQTREFLTSYSNQQVVFMAPNLTLPTAAMEQTILPHQIDLTLRLVIEQRTADNLSLYQIQEIIAFFEETKLKIRRNQGVRDYENSFQQQGEELAARANREPIIDMNQDRSSDGNDSEQSEKGPGNLPGELLAAVEVLRQAVKDKSQ